MWRIIPALLLIGFLTYYDSTHSLSKPAQLALFTACLLLALLAVLALVHSAPAPPVP